MLTFDLWFKEKDCICLGKRYINIVNTKPNLIKVINLLENYPTQGSEQKERKNKIIKELKKALKV